MRCDDGREAEVTTVLRVSVLVSRPREASVISRRNDSAVALNGKFARRASLMFSRPEGARPAVGSSCASPLASLASEGASPTLTRRAYPPLSTVHSLHRRCSQHLYSTSRVDPCSCQGPAGRCSATDLVTPVSVPVRHQMGW